MCNSFDAGAGAGPLCIKDFAHNRRMDVLLASCGEKDEPSGLLTSNLLHTNAFWGPFWRSWRARQAGKLTTEVLHRARRTLPSAVAIMCARGHDRQKRFE